MNGQTDEQSDGQTDGVQHLIRPPMEDSPIITFVED